MYQRSRNELLWQYAGRQFIGTSELAAAATRILLEMGATQERGTVKDVIDERTIRYYQTEGLLETPTEKRGPASVYEFKHLLTLIVIKHLQSADLPIRKIRRIIWGMSEGNLNSLLEETPILSRTPKEAREEARQYLDKISKTLEWEPENLKEGYLHSTRMNVSEEGVPRMGSPTSDSPFEFPPSFYSRSVPPTPQDRDSETWKRFELLSGVELHVKENAAGQLDAKTRISLLKRIENIIRSLTERE